MDVKQKLQSTALKQFSQKGYDAVSVRDITKAVGRRETCLYNYFKNKQALLQSLAETFETRASTSIREMRNALKQVNTVDRAEFMRLSGAFLDKYLTDSYFLQFARVLMIEQANSEELKRMYMNYLYIVPLFFVSELFQKTSKTDNTCSVDFLSTSFYGVILLYFQKHMMGGMGVKAMRDAFYHEVRPHMDEFAQIYVAETAN